jgi:tRNA threonylcarbamoyladenosine biosynthesis protein TsaB
MIDARRMEVFTTFYDLELNETTVPAAVVLDKSSFSNELNDHVIIFCGNGSKKWQHLCLHSNAVFVDMTQNVADLAESASKKFEIGDFSTLHTQNLPTLRTSTPEKQVEQIKLIVTSCAILN